MINAFRNAYGELRANTTQAALQIALDKEDEHEEERFTRSIGGNDRGMAMKQETIKLQRRAAFAKPVLEAEAMGKTEFLVCDSQGKVVLCSSSAATIFRGDPDEVEGLSIQFLLLERDYVGFAPPMAWDLEGLYQRPRRYRFDFLTADGREVPVKVSISRFELNQLPHYLLHLHRLLEDGQPLGTKFK